MKTASCDKRAKKILGKWFWFEKYHLDTIKRFVLLDTIIEGFDCTELIGERYQMKSYA